MDGNRRWAKERNRPARDGHSQGLERAVELVHALGRTEVSELTFFALASANWQRPAVELEHLFKLAHRALGRFVPTCRERGVRLRVIGSRARLSNKLCRAIASAEADTQHGKRRLNIALDYCAQTAIVETARHLGSQATVDDFSAAHLANGTTPVDLLIRTGREQRLSNFLLWECANAELFFSDVLWPDFSQAHVEHAIKTYQARERRFGA